jgi:hypothetical protein
MVLCSYITTFLLPFQKAEMGRKYLGGKSSLRANHQNETYNVVLENVYETAIANLDGKHTRTKNRRRIRIPNFLSLCWKSAKEDVCESESRSTLQDDNPIPTTISYSTSNNADNFIETKHGASVEEDQDAVFLMQDGTFGQASHYRYKHATLRSMTAKSLQAIFGEKKDNGRNFNDF